MNPSILTLSQHPHLIPTAAQWFSQKWGIPQEAYLESMQHSLAPNTAVPGWFVVCNTQGTIIAGLGIIENDFHQRPDLTPNLCALYVEPEHRSKGLARRLLEHGCQTLHRAGIQTAYLITGHTGLYEKMGWTYYGDIPENDGNLTRMYTRSTVPAESA